MNMKNMTTNHISLRSDYTNLGLDHPRPDRKINRKVYCLFAPEKMRLTFTVYLQLSQHTLKSNNLNRLTTPIVKNLFLKLRYLYSGSNVKGLI